MALGLITHARIKVAAFPRRQVRDLKGLPKTLGAIGPLELRLATTKAEIRRAQKLRYKVFFAEGRAKADPTAQLIQRDVCRFDRVCDHLLVVDTSILRADGTPVVAGAYRLLRGEVAAANFGFYSQSEFDVASLIARHPGKRLLELGRSCVAPAYRGKRTLELLWRGIWAYARHHGVDVMFGCASFPGADAERHAAALRFLRGEGASDALWDVEAVAGRAVAPSRSAAPIDPRAALRALPPLIKGYWRLGAKFGPQAVIDESFGATDVFAVMPVAEIEPRYLQHFGADSETTLAA
ncbi:MAG: GNAT family N-acetyltransferase [Hyphomicrobiales bacterium]|nr:GNAT family N-acetyltransferase [Hyphomicrobiales bacterium]